MKALVAWYDVVYYKSIKRELKTRPIYECRFDKRLKTKVEESTRHDTLVVYYESIKRELKTRPIYECRYDERLKTKTEESTRLAYTEKFSIPFSIFACHPCAGAMLIFSVSFQF